MPTKRPRTVIFADAARRDLIEIARYIAYDNPGRAREVSRDLRARALDLAEHPEAFAKMAEPVDGGFRKRVVGRYVIVYRLQDRRIDVVRVLHSARDIAALLDHPE